MIHVNIREARRNLSSLLSEAEKGRTVLITRRGRPVARLTPPPAPQDAALPDLAAFRKSIRVKRGAPSAAALVRKMRDRERY